MSNETYVTIRGNLGAKPVLHTGASGGRVARFDVAVAVARYQRESESTDVLPPQWFAVKAFGQLGENVTESAAKGTPVLVRGELVTEYWTNGNGEPRSRQVVRADAVGIELHSGVARFSRVVRNSPEADATDGTPASTPVDLTGAAECPEDNADVAPEYAMVPAPEPPF